MKKLPISKTERNVQLKCQWIRNNLMEKKSKKVKENCCFPRVLLSFFVCSLVLRTSFFRIFQIIVLDYDDLVATIRSAFSGFSHVYFSAQKNAPNALIIPKLTFDEIV